MRDKAERLQLTESKNIPSKQIDDSEESTYRVQKERNLQRLGKKTQKQAVENEQYPQSRLVTKEEYLELYKGCDKKHHSF